MAGDNSLDDRERRILFEYYGKGGGGVEKIASAMDSSADTIKEVLFKAFKRVREQLEFGAVSPGKEGEGVS